ncbi:MAG: LytTR family transcriptional regulator DNA-binding domain-containing protein [Bacteroidota bacterium]
MDNNLRILIVEDEFITLDLLKDYVIELGYHVSGDAINAEEAISVLEKNETDLVLLDINLTKEKDGIWVAEQINTKYKIPFIFISAYSDAETIKKAAFWHPSAYLVKPVKKIDIYTAIEVAIKNYTKYVPNKNNENSIEEDELMPIENHLFIKINSNYKKIIFSEILYFESFKNYIELHLQNEKIIVRNTLQKFLELLPQNNFIQVHRSFVVNKKYISEIKTNSIIILETEIPIGKKNKENLLNSLNLK